MKISLNWLRDYIDINETPEDLGEILTDLGLEVEGMEEVESIKGGLKGLVIGEIKECYKHPNADKLSLTKVDIGQEDMLQIVCGAPNVDKGQKVIVATVGTMLYPSEGEPFKIKKGKIRGEISEGMICAEDEIGIGLSHDGIIVLPAETAVGLPASNYYQLESDIVYEIGLTPNRSDATSHIGVASDLAAYYSFHENKKIKVTIPQINLGEVVDSSPVKVRVEDTAACPRYSGVSLGNIKIKDSPKWMQDRLKAIDVRPINNVVDITNYVLHEYGQPLHAFDYDQIANAEIIVKKLPQNTSFISLDGVERSLSESDLMICDGSENPMCIGGVFGGLNSGVTEATSKIFLEAAHFEAQGIRKSSTKHNLRTDAAKCFEKGSDPNITTKALNRAASLLLEYAEATINSEHVDIYEKRVEPKKIKIRPSKVNQVIGNELSNDEISKILNALNISHSLENSDEIIAQIPTNKADVTREIDVIEEILRIYGFNKVTTDNRIHSTINIKSELSNHELRNRLSSALVGKGFYEMMGLSLIPSELVGETILAEGVLINNTSNVGLDLMRPNMLLSVLSTVNYNFNRQQNNLRLFEFGKSYKTKEETFVETEVLSLVMAGNKTDNSWLTTQSAVDYYSIKKISIELMTLLGIESYQTESISNDDFAFGLRLFRGNMILCEFGCVSTDLVRKMDIKEDVFYSEIRLENILKSIKKNHLKVKDISKYPSSRRDLAFVIDDSVAYSDLEKIILKIGKGLISEVNLFDNFKDEKVIGKGKKSYAIAMNFTSMDGNLNDKQVDKVIEKIIKSCNEKLGAELR